MRLVTYSAERRARLGVLLDPHETGMTAGGLSANDDPRGMLLDLTARGFPASMREFIAEGPAMWRRAETLTRDALGARQQSSEFPQRASASGALDLVTLLAARIEAPLPDPGKIVGIGLNYHAQCREQGVEAPDQPLLFAKFPSSIIGPNEAITWDPTVTDEVDFEVELGVVIGQRARNVSPSAALDYVFGYTVLNDVSARDLQFGDKQWVRAKSLDTFCPLGPAIVTANEIPDPQALHLRCLVNGQPLQDSSTADMIFSVRELVSYISRLFTLEPGDIIATGTPAGCGYYREPQALLRDGDTLVSEIEGVGRLENTVRVGAPASARA